MLCELYLKYVSPRRTLEVSSEDETIVRGIMGSRHDVRVSKQPKVCFTRAGVWMPMSWEIWIATVLVVGGSIGLIAWFSSWCAACFTGHIALACTTRHRSHNSSWAGLINSVGAWSVFLAVPSAFAYACSPVGMIPHRLNMAYIQFYTTFFVVDTVTSRHTFELHHLLTLAITAAIEFETRYWDNDIRMSIVMSTSLLELPGLVYQLGKVCSVTTPGYWTTFKTAFALSRFHYTVWWIRWITTTSMSLFTRTLAIGILIVLYGWTVYTLIINKRSKEKNR